LRIINAKNKKQKELKTMNDKKDTYIQKLKAKLDEWNATIDKLQAKADQAEAESKIEYEKQLADLRTKLKNVEKKYRSLNKPASLPGKISSRDLKTPGRC
jgi:chromosome segregation ATPase